MQRKTTDSRKNALPEPKPSQSSAEIEERILAQTRKSLLAKKGYKTHYKVDKTVFELRKSVPAQMPSQKQLKLDFPGAFSEIEVLKPARIMNTYEEKKLITYYFERQRGHFRELYNWTVPIEWDRYDKKQMGRLFESLLVALCLIWASQHKFIGGQDIIELADGTKVDLLLSQPIIFTNKDVLRIFYDEPYSKKRSDALDAVYRTLYELNFISQRKVWNKREKFYKWRSWYFSRVLTKIAFGSKVNPDLRLVDISSQYVSTILKIERMEKEEEIREMLRSQRYQNVAIADVKLDYSFTKDELLLCDFWFNKTKEFCFNPNHKWTFQKFYSEVLMKSDEFIDRLVSRGALRKHIAGNLQSLSEKLKAANWPEVGKIKVLPKKNPNISTKMQTFKFIEPSFWQSST